MSETLLCVVAHPDDETLFAGGTLAMLGARGVAVHILSATRGEGGEVGDPPICTREELGRVRESELRCAAAALGARSVEFLDYVDPFSASVDQIFPFEADPEEFEGRLVDVVDRLRPGVVLTHGSQGEYGHPGHLLVHQNSLAAHRAIRVSSISPVPALYTFSAAIPGVEDPGFNETDPAHVIVDITPWLEVRSAAAACHRTQHATQHADFFCSQAESTDKQDDVRPQESLHRLWPGTGPHATMFADIIPENDCD